MIINTKEFKEACTKILNAIDSSELSTLTETLELKTEGRTLLMNVTNKEYYASIKFNLDHEEDFHATVNAVLFLKLIAQTTTEEISLTMDDTFIKIKSNGNYKLPLVYNGEYLFELPKIEINNKTVEMTIGGDVLQSILKFNSKETMKESAIREVQKLYYVDNQGCLTFSSGACVNSFELEKPVKVLFNNRLVKLFKLFKDESVKFTLGYDMTDGGTMQTKVCFETEDISVTALLPSDESLLSSVPTEAIRGRANKEYPHHVILNRVLLLEAVNRLLLFSQTSKSDSSIKTYGKFMFTSSGVSIYDSKNENVEKLAYEQGSFINDECTVMLDLLDFKNTLSNCNETFVTLNFGDNMAVVLVRNNIKNVIPEVQVM